MKVEQRKLFFFLRTKEETIFKKTVAYRDGRIIFLLIENETNKQWSRADSIFDLINIHSELEIDFSDAATLDNLGLKDCKVDIDLD